MKPSSGECIVLSQTGATELTRLADEELMRMYQNGEMAAFNILYERHSAKVYGYLRKKIANPAEAADVFQSVFMKVHRSRERYRPEYPFLSWLFAVTRTAMIDAFRKTGREGSSVLLKAADESGDSVAYAGSAGSGAEAFAPAVWTAGAGPDLSAAIEDVAGLRSLPERQRRAIALRFVEDQTFEEIAAALRTSPANVRQLISRGVRRLRQAAGLKEDV